MHWGGRVPRCEPCGGISVSVGRPRCAGEPESGNGGGGGLCVVMLSGDLTAEEEESVRLGLRAPSTAAAERARSSAKAGVGVPGACDHCPPLPLPRH